MKSLKERFPFFPYFQHFIGSFKGERYDSDRPPKRTFRNDMSCKSFVDFVRKTLVDLLTTGAISLRGKVGDVEPPYTVLLLTVEPSKPRLCHDERYLNLNANSLRLFERHLNLLMSLLKPCNVLLGIGPLSLKQCLRQGYIQEK